MKSGRKLTDIECARDFLINCLGYIPPHADLGTKRHQLAALEAKIRDSERILTGIDAESTVRSSKHRDILFTRDDQRQILRHQIISELLKQKRPSNDEKIKLGPKGGGAKPTTTPLAEKKAFLITGLPASGKSSIIAAVADKYSAYVIDPDYAKRKFPEYSNGMVGSSIIHEESTLVTIGSRTDPKERNLLMACVDNGLNIVRPMIGDDASNLESFQKTLKAFGYSVHLTLVDLDRKYASRRALERYMTTDRYVPLSYIYDHCANNPSLIYHKYRVEACNLNSSPWASLGAVSSETRPVKFIDSWGIDNPAKLFQGESNAN